MCSCMKSIGALPYNLLNVWLHVSRKNLNSKIKSKAILFCIATPNLYGFPYLFNWSELGRWEGQSWHSPAWLGLTKIWAPCWSSVEETCDLKNRIMQLSGWLENIVLCLACSSLGFLPFPPAGKSVRLRAMKNIGTFENLIKVCSKVKVVLIIKQWHALLVVACIDFKKY